MSTHERATMRLAKARPQRTLTAFASLPEFRWATAASALFAVGGLVQLANGPTLVWWALYVLCYATGGWEPAWEGLRALRQRTLDVDLLMIVAALIAASIGQVFDGALLIVIFATSGALESFATRRTEDSVQALLTLAPEKATRVDTNGREEQIDAEDLDVGDVVLVRPGERIGADGEVLEGLSDVDQSSITGEPLPALKGEGDDVFAGTLNGTGALSVRVSRPAHETVVARIVTMVEEASATKAKKQLFIEKVEQTYSISVVVGTLLLFGIPLIFGGAFEPTLLRAMTFMIVASPCAVVLATMPPMLATIANAGRHGVLVKSAVALEDLAKINVVAFDKTGTLTHGTLRVSSLTPLGTMTPDEVLRVAAVAERRSEHPVAGAIVAAARAKGLQIAEPAAFSSTPGRGVTATVDGRAVTVGSPTTFMPTPNTAVATTLEDLENSGQTVVLVVVDGYTEGLIALADRVREDAAAAVRDLYNLTGTSATLLTGDNIRAANWIAAEVGIAGVSAHLLPADKVKAIEALTADGRQVMLIGDGVNDAPAMAAARVGVAMGRNGSDLALQTADVILVRDDLSALATTIELAQRSQRVVKANLMIAGAVITTLVAWDVLGTLPLPLGVAGHEGSTILVALNGLRLLRRSAWQRS